MRHPAHDYSSAGGYFVSFSIHRRRQLLGSLQDDGVVLSPPGAALDECWKQLPRFYPRVVLDAYEIMPDHFHGIIVLTDPRLLGQPAAPLTALPEVVRGLKSMSARRINKLLNRQGQPVWQRGYHDRVIRNEGELAKFRSYIATNPLRETL